MALPFNKIALGLGAAGAVYAVWRYAGSLLTRAQVSAMENERVVLGEAEAKAAEEERQRKLAAAEAARRRAARRAAQQSGAQHADRASGASVGPAQDDDEGLWDRAAGWLGND
jgi:hypothetical protein